jgi:hypothetical protein
MWKLKEHLTNADIYGMVGVSKLTAQKMLDCENCRKRKMLCPKHCKEFYDGLATFLATSPLRTKDAEYPKSPSDLVDVSTLPKPQRNRAFGHKVKVWSTRVSEESY